ncbi:MAG TPA: hypothetical protein VM553_19755, partial [Dongiaceae bacterium]|nr:hypothetical protein [Dongiaceae bacterium]
MQGLIPFQSVFRLSLRAGSLLGALVSGLSGQAVADAAIPHSTVQHSMVQSAIESGHVGLFDVRDFRLSDGQCADCKAPQQTLWYFQGELVATPLAEPGAFDPTLRAQDDVRAWANQHPAADPNEKPALLWLGSPQTATGVLNVDGTALILPNQQTLAFSVTPKIPTNLS